MSPLARVSEEHVGDIAIAVVDGEIDASNARAVGDRLRESLTNRSHALIVDLAATSYVDSAGINLLFALDLELRQRRQHLRLIVPPQSPIARMLAITGLDDAVATHATRDAALEDAAAANG
jgi:anti-anti-sigma factor